MKNILAIVSFFIITSTFAQSDSEMIYYKGNFKPADSLTAVRALKMDKVKDSIVDITYYNKDDKQNWKPFLLKRFYTLNDSLIRIDIRNFQGQTKTHYRKFKKDSLGYKYIEENKDGVLLAEGHTAKKFPLFRQGKITSYYSNGQIETIAIYKDNIFLSNKNWKEDGSEYIANLPPLRDTDPQIEGGAANVIRKHIMRTFEYPEEARAKEISGTVLVQFILMEDMTIDGIKILNNAHPSLVKEAKRIVSLLEFTGEPAMSDGKKVRCAYSIPITFRLSD